jgi:CheY-like chemotaxis protein
MEFWLKRKGYQVKAFINPGDMLQQMKETMPDLVLLDVHLNGADGREVCKYLKSDEKLKKPVFLIFNCFDNGENFALY